MFHHERHVKSEPSGRPLSTSPGHEVLSCTSARRKRTMIETTDALSQNINSIPLCSNRQILENESGSGRRHSRRSSEVNMLASKTRFESEGGPPKHEGKESASSTRRIESAHCFHATNTRSLQRHNRHRDLAQNSSRGYHREWQQASLLWYLSFLSRLRETSPNLEATSPHRQD